MATHAQGSRIRELRLSRKMSQTQLAQDIGISASYLNLIEHDKRKISGKTLNALLRCLDVPAEALSPAHNSPLLTALEEASQKLEKTHTTAPRDEPLDAFVRQYPKWARLMLDLIAQKNQHELALQALSERLSHDADLNAALHQILSNAAAIRSTAAILAQVPDIDAERKTHFYQNIHIESQRLSDALSRLVAHLEQPAALGEDPQNVAKGEKRPKQIDPAFRSAAIAAQFDPVKIAVQSEGAWGDLPAIFRRLAELSEGETFSTDNRQIPPFGLLSIDSTGTVLDRIELPQFPLPRHGNPCGLWPIYRFWGHQHYPIRMILEDLRGERFVTLTYVTPKDMISSPSYSLPPLLTAHMLISPMSALQTIPIPLPRATPHLRVGLHCATCPIKACPARHTAYLLG